MLEVIHPTSCIKHRTGELLQVLVAAQYKDAIVELWAPLHDRFGEHAAAYPLKYQRSEGEKHFFGAQVRLDNSGYFQLRFRARRPVDQTWSWANLTVDLWVDPSWIYDAIVYNAFVRYFGAKVGEDGKISSGTFDDLRLELQKLHDMGINVLYLNPVYMIGELYRNYNPHDLLPEYLQPGCPYSIKDYKSIDPELSFEKDVTKVEHPFSEFRKLVDMAHKLGIRVFMDLVFNHSAHDAVFQRIHPEWFFYKDDITSLEAPYILMDEIKDGKPWGDPKHTFCPYDHGYWWKDAAQLNWNNIDKLPEFIQPHNSANKPPLNPTIYDMHAYFMNIVKFWIKEFGIDGFRCDVAYRVPLDFWKTCIIEARKLAKDAKGIDADVVFIAEDYHVDMKGLLEAGFTACYGDYSNKLNVLPDMKGYLDYMYNISGKFFPENSLWFIFPECHDFHRNPEKIAKDLRSTHADADLNANKSRWTVTACLPGIPMIFNGFEKIEWHPASLFSYSAIDWESDKDISEYITKVNLIRRKEVALQRGTYQYLTTGEGVNTQSKLLSFARIHNNEIIIVVVNLDVANKANMISLHLDMLPLDFTKPYVLDDLLNAKQYTREGKEIKIILEPGEAHIFKVGQIEKQAA